MCTRPRSSFIGLGEMAVDDFYSALHVDIQCTSKSFFWRMLESASFSRLSGQDDSFALASDYTLWICTGNGLRSRAGTFTEFPRSSK